MKRQSKMKRIREKPTQTNKMRSKKLGVKLGQRKNKGWKGW